MDMPLQDAVLDEGQSGGEGQFRLEAMRERGDRLRDARLWADAAEAYGAYLAQCRDDAPIMVQYGHCLKELGDPRGALVCYRAAEKLLPGDSDIQLQLGHALKLLGRQEEATDAYARALSLDPGNPGARHELFGAPVDDAAGGPDAATMPPAGPAIAGPLAGSSRVGADALLFDASDLLDYVRHNRAPTGIQRVQLNVIREALQGESTPALVCAFDPAAGAWRLIPAALFLELARLSATGTDTADPAWEAVVAATQQAVQGGTVLDFAPGTALVNLGTSWWLPDYLSRVRQAKARFGIRYIPFLHDCIPLLVPEHCAEGLIEEFARWFAGLCLHADRVLVNSACTAGDFRRLQRALLPGLEIPSSIVPLDAAPDAVEPGALPPRLADGRPFILFVGTIESRKNHLLVFQAWLSLVRRHGAERVPELVCVGKRGWLAEEALRLQARSDILRAKVHLLHDIPDTVLAALYRGCLFTLYNSFYEGWGLPVTESLAHGKVALVPEHSGLRESGAAGAVFFAPNSEPDLVEQVWRLSTDAAHRAALEQRVAAQFRPRRWAEIAARIARESALGEALPPPLARITPPLGAPHRLALLPGSAPLPAMALADAMREGEGWSALEGWGCWARPGESRLRLPLPDEATGAALRIHLEMQAPAEPILLLLRAGREDGAAPVTQRLEIPGGGRIIAVLALPPEGAGDLVIAIDPACAAGIGAERVGLCSVMVCREADLAARLAYLEPRAVAAPAD
jgi:glycosyltransferase involved in cell wall biosynthesis